MNRKGDVLQCPDCNRPDGLRIRYETDPDTAVCGYCGSTVCLMDFAKERRRVAIGTIAVGLILLITGVGAWQFTDDFHGYFNTGSSGLFFTVRSFQESRQYDFMPVIRMFGTFFAAIGAIVVLCGLRSLLGWGKKRSLP